MPSAGKSTEGPQSANVGASGHRADVGNCAKDVRLRSPRRPRCEAVRRPADRPWIDHPDGMAQAKRRLLRRGALGAVGVAIAVATFVFFLPTIANYGEVWGVVKELTWPWALALLAATVLNLVTFAPPWQVALPGLSFIRAMELTQASTALSIVAPGGAAVGAAGAFRVLRRWGFAVRDFTRAVTLTGLWNQFLNLSFPIVAVFLLAITGQQTAALATVAFVGVAVLGVVLAAFSVVLVSNRLANDLGDVIARLANWGLGKIGRGPVGWGGSSFERF